MGLRQLITGRKEGGRKERGGREGEGREGEEGRENFFLWLLNADRL